MDFFIYLAQVSLYAIVMWGIYCAVWRGKPLLRGSRIFLLFSLLLPLVLPFMRLPARENTILAGYHIFLPEITIGGTKPTQDGMASLPCIGYALAGYFALSCVLLLTYAAVYLRLFLKTRKGQLIQNDGYTLYKNTGIGPGTIWRTVFFPGSEVHPVILNHELAHIRAGHRWDAALMQVLHVIFWASPAHWIIARELKLVHEYEADRIAASGPERHAYAELLLSQSLGARRVSIGHSFFHHPLKRRLIMLQKTSLSNRKILVAICAGLTAILISTALLAQTKKPAAPQQVAKRSAAQKSSANTKPSTLKAGDPKTLSDGRVVYKLVDKMPGFNGDLSAWLGSNLHYPDSARAHGHAGRSVVQFIVEGDGRATDAEIVRSSGHSLLDAEALRVVTAMPRWTPGKQAGAEVPVYFTLPITFKLD